MALPREEVIAGVKTGMQKFEDLARSLTNEEWAAPTRCEGWVVRDVVAHVAGTQTAIAEGRLDHFADPAHVKRDTDARADKSPDELADEIHGAMKVNLDIVATFDDNLWNSPAPAGVNGTMGDAVEVLWYDAYVHAEDICAALDRTPLRDPAGIKASISHLAGELERQGWGPATLALDGLDEVQVNGGGRRVTGDPLTFILAATGREDPAVLGLDETVNVYRPQQ